MNELMISRTSKPTMTSLEIAELVEKRHDNVKRTIETLVSAGVIELPQIEEVKNHLGQTVSVYQLDKRSSLIAVAQLSPEFTARVVDRWQELEAQATKQIALPDFTDPAAAAIAWAEQYRARQLAEKTKAEIGSRREATSMATASSAVRKAQKLEAQLDMLKEYATVKYMEKMTHGLKFNWRELKSASAIMELPPIDVFDQNYGSVKAYHRDVWAAVYALDTDGEQCLPELAEESDCQYQ